jgi:hypothetical protein
VRSSLLLAALTLLAPSVAAAQGTPAVSSPEIILVGGINVSTMTTSVPEVTIPEFSLSTGSRIGFVGGVLVGFPLTTPIAIETGGLLSVKGGTTILDSLGVHTEIDLRMTYLDVPALVRVGVAKNQSVSGFLLAGPTVSFHLSSVGRLTTTGSSISDTINDLVKPVDLGLTIGGRLQFKRVIADVRYSFGLLNAADASQFTDAEAKHRVLSFMGGWRF